MELVCPKCLSVEIIKLDLDDGDTLTCGGCDETYQADDVAHLVEGWLKVLPWIRQHPARVRQEAEAR